MFSELVFLDDFFRGPECGLQSHPINRRFLRAFFEGAATRLGWKVREIHAQSQKGAVPVGQLLRELDLPASPAGWAAACAATISSESIVLDSMALSQKSLVIGWGLPPSIIRLIDSLGISFIDIEVYSLRFARHLFLCARTNDEAIRRELKRLRVNDEVFWASAAGLKGFFARRGQGFVVAPDLKVGLFLGQTEVDLALVEQGFLRQPSDFMSEIVQWAKEVDILAIKPHPYHSTPDQFTQLLEEIPNAALVDFNVYELMCAENLNFIGSLSSGALKESRYFGCRDVRQLLHDDRNDGRQLPGACSSWFPVGAEIASIDSLRAFDRHGGASTWWNFLTPKSVLSTLKNGGFSDDVLDQIFETRWGLNDARNLPNLWTLTYEKEYRPAADQAERTWLGAGWHEPESWGVWSSSSHASLLIPLSTEAIQAVPERLALRLRGRAFRAAGVPSPSIEIFVNGRICQKKLCDEVSGMFEWSVELDDVGCRGGLLVRVSVVGAVSPRSVGVSADGRSLGLALESITLVHVTQKSEI